MILNSCRLPGHGCGRNLHLVLFLVLCCSISVGNALSLASEKTSCSKFLATDDSQVVEEQLGYLPRNFMCVSARTELGSPIAIKTYPLLQKTHFLQYNDAGTTKLMDLSAPKSTWGTPFPTHYWLTCPVIAKAIGEVERLGYIALIEDYLNLEINSYKRQQLLQCHIQCGVDRWKSLLPTDRDFFLQHAEADSTVANMKFMMQQSGIAGTDYQQHTSKITTTDSHGALQKISIKCLHTHYAHFCSTTTWDERNFSDDGGANKGEENPIGRITHELLRAKFPSLVL